MTKSLNQRRFLFTASLGPAISEAGTFRQIFSISILNSGKIPLKGVTAEILTPSSQIDKLVVDQTSGLHPHIENTSVSYRLTLDRLLPTEQLNLSAMTTSIRADPELKINVRSDEALGTSQSVKPTSATDQLLLVVPGAISSALAVAVMALFLSSRRIRGLVTGYSKPDIITYIISLSNVFPISDEVMFTEHKLTYARTADLFLFFGSRGDDNAKARCILGLKSLLLVSQIAEGSVEIIKSNLLALDSTISEQELDDLRAEAVTFAHSKDLRQKIWRLFHPLRAARNV